MTRSNKLDLLRGILKGTRSIDELKPIRYAIAYQHPRTGEVSGRSPYRAKDDNSPNILRNMQMLELSKTDRSITVIRIEYTKM